MCPKNEFAKELIHNRIICLTKTHHFLNAVASFFSFLHNFHFNNFNSKGTFQFFPQRSQWSLDKPTTIWGVLHVIQLIFCSFILLLLLYFVCCCILLYKYITKCIPLCFGWTFGLFLVYTIVKSSAMNYGIYSGSYVKFL